MINLILSCFLLAGSFMLSCTKSNNKQVFIKEITIGDQVWAAENLSVEEFRNGDPIPQAKTQSKWQQAEETKQPAWCYVAYDSVHNSHLGKLYNWYAINDPRGLAPNGFHIPKASEWETLISHLGKNDAASRLKAQNGWKNDGAVTSSKVFKNGLNVLPAGFNNTGCFIYEHFAAYFWTSTMVENEGAVCFNIWFNNKMVESETASFQNGMSVRCIKDK